MNKLMIITLSTLVCSSSLNAANQVLELKPKSTRSTLVEVKKKPNGCKAFGDAIRNIRTVKELQRELNTYSEETIKECINEFRHNKRIMNLFDQWSQLNKSGR